MYTLRRQTFLPIEIGEAWDFFCNPRNLGVITPAEMDFRILNELPDEIYGGLIIQYTLRPLFGIKAGWVTEITQINKPFYFTDVQLSGPYAIWHHQHHFSSRNGGTEMEDIVNYKLPFGPIGRIAHWLFLRKKVEEIFDYRAEVLKKKFSINIEL